jgi:hypothetical protein
MRVTPAPHLCALFFHRYLCARLAPGRYNRDRGRAVTMAGTLQYVLAAVRLTPRLFSALHEHAHDHR